jgi:hypothetical protein
VDLDEWRRLNATPTPDDYLQLLVEGRVNPHVAALFKALCPGGIENLRLRMLRKDEEDEDDEDDADA